MDEREFIQRCSSGDRQARDEFCTRYCRLIYSYMLCVLRTYGAATDTQDLRDFFHEFIKSLFKDNCRKLRNFSGRNNCTLAGWLRPVTVNFTIDILRRKRSAAVSLDEELAPDLFLKDMIVDPRPLPSETAVTAELADTLAECIRLLGLEGQYFIELHFNQGMGLEELAGHYRTSRAGVDMRKARILARLRACFRKKGVRFPDAR